MYIDVVLFDRTLYLEPAQCVSTVNMFMYAIINLVHIPTKKSTKINKYIYFWKKQKNNNYM